VYTKIGIGIALLGMALSQQATIQITTQEERIFFGEEIAFSVRATSSTPITSAILTVQVAEQPLSLVFPIDVTPANDQSLRYPLNVQENGIPPFASLTYTWEIGNEAGEHITSEPRTLRYEDTNVPWTWAAATSGSITVHTDGEDPVVAQAALEIAQGALTRISQTLQIPVPPDVHIYVYPELSQLVSGLYLHGRQPHDWVAAYSLPDQSVVLVAASPGPEMLAQLRRDLPHELTHVAIYHAAGLNANRVPGWFNEGVAIMSTDEPDPTLHTALDDAIREQRQMPLEALCIETFAALPPGDAVLAYAQSESVVQYISDRFGSVGLQNLMAVYADGATCDAGISRALGVPMDTLEGQWLESRQRNLTRTSTETNPLLPWLLIWGASLALAALFLAPQIEEEEEESTQPVTPLRPRSNP
jgi:hypothetical protein